MAMQCGSLCSSRKLCSSFEEIVRRFSEKTNFRRFIADFRRNHDKCVSQRHIDRKGHPLYCLCEFCHSDFLFLRQLSVHFPSMWSFLKVLYEVQKVDRNLSELDSALIRGETDKLEVFIDLFSSGDYVSSCTVGDRANIPEWRIQQLPYVKDFLQEIYQKPSFACVSCNVLHYRKEVQEIRFYCDAVKLDIRIFVGSSGSSD